MLDYTGSWYTIVVDAGSHNKFLELYLYSCLSLKCSVINKGYISMDVEMCLNVCVCAYVWVNERVEALII